MAEALTEEAVAGVSQPYHGGRFIISYKGGSLNGWSYPSAEAAQADLDAIRAALVQPAVAAARREERERCAKAAEAISFGRPEGGTMSAEYRDGHSDGTDVAQAVIAAALRALKEGPADG